MKKLCLSSFVISCLLLPTTAAQMASSRLDIEPAYVEGEVLVQSTTTVLASQLPIAIEFNRSLSIADTHFQLLRSSSATTAELIASVQDTPGVISVQPNYIYHVTDQTIPWGTTTDGVRAEAEAHDLGYTGNGIVVAVIDTGVDYAHEDLVDNMWSAPANSCLVSGVSVTCPNHGYDFVSSDSFGDGDGQDNDPLDYHSHGTHVAGTVAASDNTIGVIGVAPEADIMAVRVLDASGYGTSADIISGIDFATANGADVINMSIGGAYYDAAEETAVTAAWEAGVVVIAAAGNESLQELSYPAGHEHAISVGAVQQTVSQANPDEDMNTRLAFFSNYGTTDVVGPGRRINSTVCNCNGYDGSYSGDTWDGTSMAAPHIAGAAALLLQAYPDLTPDQVRHVLATTATDLGTAGRDLYFGSGLVNTAGAVGELTDSLLLVTNYEVDQTTVAPVVYLPIIPADGSSTTQVYAELMDSNGRWVADEPVVFNLSAGQFSDTGTSDTTVNTDSNGRASVTIVSTTEPITATLTATTADYGTTQAVLEFTNVLLVSDGAEWYWANNLSWWTIRGLRDDQRPFVRFDTMRADATLAKTITADYLNSFQAVVWILGEYGLNDADQTTIQNYLDAGGNILLTGQDILFYIEEQATSDIVVSDYFNFSPLASDGVVNSYTGDNGGSAVTGADIFLGEQYELVEYSSSGLGPDYVVGLLPDWGTIETNGTTIATYDDVAGETAGVQVAAGYRSIILGYGIETISSRTARHNLLNQSLSFLQNSSVITDAHVVAGTNNADHVINSENVDAVAVSVTFAEIPSSGYAGVTLSDDLTAVTASAAVDLASPTVLITDIAATSLNDGSIVVSAAHTDNSTTFPTTFTGTSATKTTSSPGGLLFSNQRSHQITVSWKAVSGTLDHYDVSYGNDSLATDHAIVTTAKTSLTINDLEPNTDYYFKVRADDGTTTTPYSVIGTTKTLAARPTNVKITKRGPHLVKIHWSKTSSEYTLRYGTNQAATNRARVTVSKNRKSLKKLASNRRYYIKVAAVNSTGSSRFSRPKRARTLPAKVKGVDSRAVTATTATVHYEQVKRHVSYYHLALRDLSGNTTSLVINSRPYHLTGLTPATLYAVKIRAIHGQLAGPWSNVIRFTTSL